MFFFHGVSETQVIIHSKFNSVGELLDRHPLEFSYPLGRVEIKKRSVSNQNINTNPSIFFKTIKNYLKLLPR